MSFNWKPSDQLITDRVAKYLQPGEQIYVQAWGYTRPNFGWIFFFGTLATFFFKYYALAVKETGLVMTECSAWGLGEKSATVLPWNGIFNVTLEEGMLENILGFQTADGKQWQIRIGKAWGVTNNKENGKLLAQYVHTWSQAVQNPAQE